MAQRQRFQQNSSIFPALAIPKLQLANLPKSILIGPHAEGNESHALQSQTERSGRFNPILPNKVPSHCSAVTSRPSVNFMQNIVCFSSFDPFKSKNLPPDLVQYLDLLENKVRFSHFNRGEGALSDDLILIHVSIICSGFLFVCQAL